ncbi:hypothetical protein [Rhodothermus profundi]|nr:hypothetical protein [Rhodothermus profundi]
MWRAGMLLAGVLLVAGCNLVGPTDTPLPALIGSWEWEVSVGGIAGIRLTPEDAGYTVQLTFHANRTFIWHRSDQPPLTGYYQLFQRNKAWYIRYRPSDGRFMPEQRITFIASDTLLLNDRCADCFSHRFHRMP